MPVQASMESLTAVAASNSPAGTDSISNTLDDYLRAIQAILRHTEAQGANLASANSLSTAAATGGYVHVTGTTTIVHLGTASAGIVRTLVFDDALTLTHNGTSLILPGGANITTAAGDIAVFRSEGSGNWRCVSYTRSSGAVVLNNAVISGIKTATFYAEYDNGNSGAAKVVSLINGTKQKITLDADTSLSISTSAAGVGHYQLRLIQDGVGGHTCNLASIPSTRWLNTASTPSINGAIDGETMINFFWDGTAFTAAASKVGAP